MQIKRSILAFMIVSSAALALFGYHRKNYKETDGFSVSSIQFDIPFNENWEVRDLSDEGKLNVEHILKMP